MKESRKTKAQLVSEVLSLRNRMEALVVGSSEGRRRNLLLREFFDALPYVGFCLNTDGEFLEVIAEEENSFPGLGKRLKGILLRDLVTPEDCAELENSFHETATTGTPQSCDYAPAALKGRRVFVACTSLTAPSTNGNSTILCVFEEATDRKTADAALQVGRKNKKKSALGRKSLQEIVEFLTSSLPLPIAFVGSNRRLYYLNNMFEAWFPGDGKPLEGQTIENVFGPANYVPLRHQVEKALVGYRSVGQVEIRRNQKDFRTVKAFFYPLSVGQKGSGSFFVVLVDLTQGRMAEVS